jgi:hypothetical protein
VEAELITKLETPLLAYGYLSVIQCVRVERRDALVLCRADQVFSELKVFLLSTQQSQTG